MPSGLLDFLGDPVERANIRQGFMDAVNRGAIGSLLGAPVDMTNLLLNAGKAGVGYVGHKAGLLSANQLPELTENPVGGSEWFGRQMQNAGMVSDKRNPTAEAIAGLLPVSPSTSAKAVAAVGAGGVMPGLDAAATVWHGSPHVFDRFDASKIGTGEGAQAYGHGLYLADAPEVARTYKNAGDGSNFVTVRSIRDPAQMAATALDRAGGDIRHATTVLAQNAQSGDITAGAALQLLKQRAALPESKYAGNLYKVDLPDEAIAKMLDWDKPLSQQAPEVLDAMRKVAGAGRYMNLGGTRQFIEPPPAWMTGGAAYARVGRMLDQGDAAASNALRQAGIPGIRYLDAGSRSAGQGSSNFVVFPGNEGLLTIVERNGQPKATAPQPMSVAAANKYFKQMADAHEDDLRSVLYNWNESELSNGRIVNYPGRDSYKSLGVEGGRLGLPKQEFLAWLASDAPFDTKVYGKNIGADKEWSAQINKLRGLLTPGKPIK
jgi:hypothetical protein